MSKKNKKEISKLDYDTELESVDNVLEVLEDDVNETIFDFIGNKIAQNLEMNINISKNKKNGKIGLSFSMNYDDKD